MARTPTLPAPRGFFWKRLKRTGPDPEKALEGLVYELSRLIRNFPP